MCSNSDISAIPCPNTKQDGLLNYTLTLIPGPVPEWLLAIDYWCLIVTNIEQSLIGWLGTIL